MVVGGCGKNSPSPIPAPPEDPVPGGTLRIAVQSDASTLDPHTATDAASFRMAELMHATLLQYTDRYGDIAPWLAESWFFDETGTELTLQLRQNAVFHHTHRPVTSQDVVYSLNRIREKGVRGGAFDVITKMDTPDDQSVVLYLSEPSAPILTALAHPMSAIVDRVTVEQQNGRLDRADGGCGPFVLEQWTQDRHLKLRRFDAFFEPQVPLLDAVHVLPVSDGTARTTALRNGEVDLLPSLDVKDTLLLEKQPDLILQTTPGTFWEYLGMNCNRTPLKDPRVRNAISLALDRPQLLGLIKFGRGEILDGGSIPSTHWAHLPEAPYAQPNTDQARQLLKQAGVDEPLYLTLTVGSDFSYQVDAAQVVKQQLSKAGIEVRIEALESGIFFDKLNRGAFELTLVGWLGFVDPDEWLYELFHSAGKWNQQGYANPEVDQLLEQGRRELDQEKRTLIYQQAQRILLEEAPMAFLYLNDQISAQRPSVQSYAPHPTGTLRTLRYTWLWRPTP